MTLKEFWSTWGHLCTFRLGSTPLEFHDRGTALRPLLPKQGHGSGGVCEAMCIDWIRRKKLASETGEYKDSFAASRHDGVTREEVTTRPSDEHRVKSMLDERFLPVHKHITKLGERSLPSESPEDFRLRAHKSVQEHFPLYAKLEIRAVADGEILWLNKQTCLKDGRDIFKAILHEVENDQKSNDFLEAGDRLSPCYVVDLAGRGHAGHALAFEINESRFHLLDPNAGEFQLLLSTGGKMLPTAKEQLYKFFDDWWKVYREVFGNRFGGWHLYQYYPAGD